MGLVEILEAGRRDFLDATRDISPKQAGAKTNPSRWSVLECIEHVAALEALYLNWIATGRAAPPKRNAEREMRLFATIRDRSTKLETADVFRPQGRFATLTTAVAEFEAVRDRTIQLVRESGDALYSIGITHSYFGKLNGVEVIHLIDGHSRRHADQIREIFEPIATPKEVRMRSSHAVKRQAFKRDPPDFPIEFASTDGLAAMEDSGAVSICEARLQDLERPNLKVSTLRIEGSVLERVKFAGGEFGSAVWKDVRLIGCDLANIRAHRISLVRAELIDCRFTGFAASAIECRDVLIQSGEMRYAQFRDGNFRACEFDRCNWQEADLQNADLSGSVFRLCDLSQADLKGAKLQNTDFRGSEVEGLVVGMSDLRGAIVDPAQAMIFARLLGLQIS